MAECNFVEKEDRIECRRCGIRFPTYIGVNARAMCKKRGLGDWVALALSKVGIKKKPGCGCEERQKKLNKVL